MLATPLSGGAHRPAIDGGLGSKEIKIWRALQRPSRARALAALSEVDKSLDREPR